MKPGAEAISDEQDDKQDAAAEAEAAPVMATVAPAAEERSYTPNLPQVPLPKKDEWVCCERCEKWRRLPSRVSASDLPDRWYCDMNDWGDGLDTCEAEEETHPETPPDEVPKASPTASPAAGPTAPGPDVPDCNACARGRHTAHTCGTQRKKRNSSQKARPTGRPCSSQQWNANAGTLDDVEVRASVGTTLSYTHTHSHSYTHSATHPLAYTVVVSCRQEAQTQTTAVVSGAIVGNAGVGSLIALSDSIFKTSLMVVYDQFWNRIDWGKELENVDGDGI